MVTVANLIGYFADMTRLKATTGTGKPAKYAMLETQALLNLDELMKTNMQAARLIVALIRFLEPNSGGVVIVSKKTMAEMMDVSEATVSRSLRELVAGNWIHRTRVGSAHAIAINDTVAWVGKRDTRRFAVFTGTVIASRAEQDEADLEERKLRQLPVINPDEVMLQHGEIEPPAQTLLDGTELVATTAPRTEEQQDLPLLD